MLNPSYLLHAVEPAEEIAEQLHTDILRRIIERMILRFNRGDDYILTPVDKWQIETLQETGYLLEDIQKELAAATGKMQSEIAEAMEDAGVTALAGRVEAPVLEGFDHLTHVDVFIETAVEVRSRVVREVLGHRRELFAVLARVD